MVDILSSFVNNTCARRHLIKTHGQKTYQHGLDLGWYTIADLWAVLTKEGLAELSKLNPEIDHG